MKTLLLFALLAITNCHRVEAALLPAEPTGFDQSFYVTADTDVALCVKAGTLCGPTKRIPGSATTQSWNNCGLTLVKPTAPAGSVFECRSVVTAPAAPPAPIVVCGPEFKSDIWNMSFKTGEVPAGVSTRWTHYVVWRGKQACGGKLQVQLYNLTELAQLIAAKVFTDPEVNAWTASQTTLFDTPAEKAFKAQVLADHATYWVPIAPRYVVQPTSATVVGTRPVYRLKADGTRNTSAVSGVRAVGNTPCDATKRIGTTNYYNVPSLGDVYAICVLVP